MNIAKDVEILNLSGNNIAVVEDNSFKDLTEIINLSLARNSISSIFLFAFAPLKKITFLDLSDNRLEVFSPDLFESNEVLTSLDISKNKFMFLQDEPLIRCKSLEFLSLQNSHLSHIFNSFFTETPNLLNLDLSNNLLITASSSAFKNLKNLHSINLEYNRFSCDSELEKTLAYLKAKNVVVKIDRCVKNSKKPMFEKMIMLPTVTAPPAEDIEIEVVWGKKLDTVRANRSSNAATRYYENIVEDEYKQECKRSEADESNLCECYQNFVNLYELRNHTNHILKERMEVRLVVIFNLGVFLGVLFGCTILYSIHVIITKCKDVKKKTVELQRRRNEITRTHQVQEIRLAEHSSPRNSPISALRNSHNIDTVELRNAHRQRVQNIQRQHEENSQSYRPSSTAQLIHKLFRNREPRSTFVSHVDEQPLRVRSILENEEEPTTSSAPTTETQVIEVQVADPETITIRSSTPPPPYRSIFD